MSIKKISILYLNFTKNHSSLITQVMKRIGGGGGSRRGRSANIIQVQLINPENL